MDGGVISGLCETLLAVVITGCYWGETAQEELWADCLERVANWGLLKAGLFGGSLEQAKTAKAKFDAFIGILAYF